MPEARKWFDTTQPQTLQGAVMLSYITAIFGLIAILVGGYIGIVPVVLAVSGYGIANEKKWAYVLGIIVAGLVVLTDAIWLVGGAYASLLNLLFAVVLFALLVHPQSREYQRIWFK